MTVFDAEAPDAHPGAILFVGVVSGGGKNEEGREREVLGHKMRSVRGTVGRNVEPSSRRHTFLPSWKRMRSSVRPNAVPVVLRVV